MRRGEHILFILCIISHFENTDFLCYPKSMSLYFDLFSSSHDKEEFDNYFVNSQGAYLLQHFI